MLFNCWKCGKKIEYPSGSRVLRADACPQCNSDLHCCRNCQFYDTGKHNQCNSILMACRGGPSDAGDTKKRLDSLFKV
jgi:DNA-directed RNA polymerase subunit RPC12/RpoP